MNSEKKKKLILINNIILLCVYTVCPRSSVTPIVCLRKSEYLNAVFLQ